MSQSTRAALATGVLLVLTVSACYSNTHARTKSNAAVATDATLHSLHESSLDFERTVANGMNPGQRLID